MAKNCGTAMQDNRKIQYSIMHEASREEIDFMLHFIDLLELGRREDITANKPLPAS